MKEQTPSENSKQSVPIQKSLKATWSQALCVFILPIIIAFVFRWILFEPYVIPSGSMIPSLLIHDHLMVNKWVYGWRWPFSEKWFYIWTKPQPGEVVVFKYPKSKDTYFIKRVVAVEGDEISVVNGQLIRNGQPVLRDKITDVKQIPKIDQTEVKSFEYYKETLGKNSFISRDLVEDYFPPTEPIKVPPGHFFVVGDNRDESSDSRVWGFVPVENLMGRAWFIWLSCENTLPASPMICDPNTIRWDRFFKHIQ